MAPESEQEKVELWRHKELLRLFPTMAYDDAYALAHNLDHFLLEKAERLARNGCSADLALRILS